MIADAVLACVLSASDVAYVQEALDGWTVVTRDLLHVPAATLPWMVLYSRTCAYHLAPDPSAPLAAEGRALEDVTLTYAGASVTVRALALKDEVALPNGAHLPIAGVAFTSLYGEEGREQPFFVTALPDVWAQDPKYADDTEDWPPFVLEVLSHELVHTRQMVGIMKQLDALHTRFPVLPAAVDDDWLQNTFEPKAAGMDATVRAEVELLHQAASEPDPERARRLVRTALALLHARRSTYYGADAAAYAAMEDVFLNMEGVACWSAFKLTRSRHPEVPPARALDVFRGNRKFWSQETGLALFLTLDRFVPDWPRRVFPPELASPVVVLLDGALATDRR